jgi:hypothetical protein
MSRGSAFFDEVAGGTEITHVVDIDFPSGPFGWLERWALRRRLTSMQASSLQALSTLGRASER